jgi:hypothetical protein
MVTLVTFLTSVSQSRVSQSLFDAYTSFCRAPQVKAVDSGSFGAYLKKIGIKKSRPMKSGVRVYYYNGTGLKTQ